MDPPDVGTKDYRDMTRILNNFIGNSSYEGTVYRGLDVKNEKEVNKLFADGRVITANTGKGEKFASFTTDVNAAGEFTTNINSGQDSVPVILRVTNPKNAKFLPGTKGSMNEVLTKNSNRYEVLRKKKGRLAGAGGRVGYIVWLKQL
jgi:hypothetical protein